MIPTALLLIDSNHVKHNLKVIFILAVAVSLGRTRSLVEKFERQGRFSGIEDQTTNTSSDVNSDKIDNSTMLVRIDLACLTLLIVSHH